MRPLTDWDDAYLLEVANGQVETEFFEKKGSALWTATDAKLKLKIAQAVCALSNSGGGFFVIGMEKDSGFDAGIEELRGRIPAKEWIEGLIPTLVRPAVYDCTARFMSHTSAHVQGKGVLIVGIPPSNRRPHWIIRGHREIAYIRAGEHSLPMRMQTILDIESRADARVPQLDVSLNPSPPDCQRIRIMVQAPTQAEFRGEVRQYEGKYSDAYYFRLRVENRGVEAARDVEVSIDDVMRRQGSVFVPVPNLLSQNLTWSHVGGTTYKIIPPGMAKHCDLGRVVKPSDRHFLGPAENPECIPPNQAGFSLSVVGPAFTAPQVLPVGEYEATISVAASNSQTPTRKKLSIHVSGIWSDGDGDMLKNHLRVALQ
jgi:hypothetical protein